MILEEIGGFGKTPRKQIILVSGNLCSGKGHFCKTNYPDYKSYTISDIVRQISKFETRSQMSTTKDLDQQIAHLLIDSISASPHQKIIVDGIRQLSIMKAVIDHFGDQVKDVVWLEVPENTRRQRFTARSSKKDDQTFDAAHAGDVNLGIEEVEKFIKQNYSVVKN